MMYLDDPRADTWPCDVLDDYGDDYDNQADVVSRLLPWLSREERSSHRLADSPNYPGLYAEHPALERFAQGLTLQHARLVDCRVNLGPVRLPVVVDLVTLRVYVYDNGRQVPWREDTVAHIEFPQARYQSWSYVQLRDGWLIDVRPDQVASTTDALAQAGVLPALSVKAAPTTACRHRRP